jgi:Arc/MetJ-type ribon-helix-helix transcriptional regulator
MKVSVSLPNEDIEFLDSYASSQGIMSRSAAVHVAVRLLKASELGPDYEEAWSEWSRGDDGKSWEITASDGLN